VGFFTDGELAELSIQRMILHVVSKKNDEFEPQAELELNGVNHLDFFRARLLDSAVDSVHTFKEVSDTKTTLRKMAGGQVSFQEGAQELSRRFGDQHPKTSTSGAFFVFELTVEDPAVRLYGMIKYDYREAVELYQNEGKNALRQIVQAFVQEKGAIQKSAIVRTRYGEPEAAVSARDRMGNAPDLTDYFERFLGVKRDRDNLQLSRDLTAALRSTLEEVRDHLPDRDVPRALRTAKQTLQARESVDDQAVREAVFVAGGRPEGEDVRAALTRSVDRQLRSRRLTGVSFKPDPAVLRTAPRRRLRTAEGVTIEFPGDLEGTSVQREETPQGGVVITVKTAEKLTEDGTLPDKTRALA